MAQHSAENLRRIRCASLAQCAYKSWILAWRPSALGPRLALASGGSSELRRTAWSLDVALGLAADRPAPDSPGAADFHAEPANDFRATPGQGAFVNAPWPLQNPASCDESQAAKNLELK